MDSREVSIRNNDSADFEGVIRRLAALEEGLNQLHQNQERRDVTVNDELVKLHRTIIALLIEIDRPLLALEHCKSALNMRSGDPQLLRDFGDANTLAERYDDALDAYRALIGHDPDDQELHELLAGVHAVNGDVEKGRTVLRDMFYRLPLELRRRGEPNDPIILRVSGLDGTYCKIARRKNGRPRPSYRGGHFTTRYLLPRRGYTVVNWTIALDNINRRYDIPRHDLILNTIAEPDTERRSLQSLATYLEAHPSTPVINHPARVLETARENNCRRFSELDGITFPKTERVTRKDGDAKALVQVIEERGFAFPVILRETGTHTARTVALANTADDALRYFEDATGKEFYFIQFIDERVEEKYYNKKRMFCIDGELYPVVSHLDDVWNVHGGNRKTLMLQNPWMQEQERDFVNDPAGAIGKKNYAILRNLHSIVGLDFFGIDFNIRADGTILIFELNASMRHSNDHSRNFSYLQPHIDCISDSFAEMIRRRIAQGKRS